MQRSLNSRTRFAVLIWIMFSGLLTVSLFPQRSTPQGNIIRDLLRKIETKIKTDQTYLNIYEIKTDAAFFQMAEQKLGIPIVIRNTKDEDVVLSRQDPETEVKYNIGVIDNPAEAESLIFVYIARKVTSTNAAVSGFGTQEETAEGEDAQFIKEFFRMTDFFYLLKNYPEQYQQLRDVVMSGINEDKFSDMPEESPIMKKMREKIKSDKGKASTTNIEHIEYLKFNGIHYYPSVLVETEKKASGRRGGKDMVVTQPGDFMIDASFSHLSFTMKEMIFGPGIAGIELNTKNRLLNALPWQSPQINFGVRFMVNLTGEDTKGGFTVKPEDLIIDGKILARLAMNTPSLNKVNPFLTNKASRLNVTSGVNIELTTTRFFRLPVFNLFFSIGSNKLPDPVIRFSNSDGSDYAYFSSMSWSATMNFYWLTSSSRTGRFKCEIGLGQYNVFKAVYKDLLESSRLISNNIYPIIGLDFNFIYKNSEILGIGASYFDSRLKGSFWLRAFSFDEHVFRLETEFISSPFLRTLDEWETEGGVFFQIRYRYGL